MKCTVYDLEVIGSNPGWVELGVLQNKYYVIVWSSMKVPTLPCLNKSINATVNIFIFSFLTYLFQSISTRRESLSRINIFHNYTVYHYY